MENSKIIKKVQGVVTKGIIAYILINVIYVFALLLFGYFNKLTHNVNMSVIIASAVIMTINLNVMSVIFLTKFNKIIQKIDNLIYTLGYEE